MKADQNLFLFIDFINTDFENGRNINKLKLKIIDGQIVRKARSTLCVHSPA